MKPQAENTYRQRLNEASKLLNSGNHAEAFSIYESLAEEFPGKHDPLFFCGVCAINMGHTLKATSYFLKASELEPNNAETFSWLGRCFRIAGYDNEAIARFSKALEIDERHLTALVNLGNIYASKWVDNEAAKFYERALAIKPSMVDVLINLSMVQSRLGDYEQAIKYASKAIRLDPKNNEAYDVLGKIHLMHGHVDKATQNFQKAIDINPHNGYAYASIVGTKKITENDSALIRKMENVLKQSMPVEHRKNLLFALGKAYDDLKQSDKAFFYMEKANMLVHSNYRPAVNTQKIKKIKNVFDKSYFAKPVHVSTDRRTPVFIVGMFRSGSTLVDQILSAHSKARSIGESTALPEIINQIKLDTSSQKEFPDFINDIDDNVFQKYYNSYFEQAGVNGEKTSHSIDKNLNNFENLGLIARFFPNAKIINTLRHPLDTCFSIYMTGFIEHEHTWSHNLEYIGKFYRDYVKLMEYWREVLPIPILDVRYEDMVSDTETTVRKLLDFCDLDWEDNCLDFYKARRGVTTSSVWQVRQPIYKSAMQRWVPYANHLQPLIMALGDLVEDDYQKIESLGLKHGPKRNSIRGKFSRLLA